MNRIQVVILLLSQLFYSSAFAISCADSRDTFSDYDNNVKSGEINVVDSKYYVMSYSWAPGHCSTVSANNKKPGGKDYLQCDSGSEFGYILHGLWPQGALDKSRGYPRACEGHQAKIDRKILEKYLCMTPSVWLLQHEYEYHGTCMHDESLETPEKYFNKALELHLKIKLPEKQLPYNKESVRWFVENNPHITADSIQYYKKGKEWQFCYDNDFNMMACPNKSDSSGSDSDCKVKGNISNNSGKKYYFTEFHPNYSSVVITPSKGERCFDSEQAAINAGWIKAP